MSPTVIQQQQQETQQFQQPTKASILKTKEHFLTKRVIVCQTARNKDILKGFTTLLNNYPQWSNQIVIVFIATGAKEEKEGENIYYYEKETHDLITSTMAAVNITKSADNEFIIYDAITLNQAKINNIKDSTAVANLLIKTLYTQPLETGILLNAYKNTQKRLFLFDYDGTLTPIVSNPADAQPTPTLLHHLESLCKDPCNTVWIISGRDQVFLDTYLGKIPRLGLSAEHGSFMKKAGLNDWIDMLQDADMSWKEVALSIFEKYTSCNPGTVIEQKKSSITWHYRNANNTEEAEKQSELCHKELMKIPGVDILVGKMNLEVRSLLVNKGEVVKRIKQKQLSDLIMCAGDDSTDEDMFRALKDDNQAFCVSVGPLSKKTNAKYCVDNSEDVVNIIGQLVNRNSTL